jgi:hypothetical protein
MAAAFVIFSSICEWLPLKSLEYLAAWGLSHDQRYGLDYM